MLLCFEESFEARLRVGGKLEVFRPFWTLELKLFIFDQIKKIFPTNEFGIPAFVDSCLMPLLRPEHKTYHAHLIILLLVEHVHEPSTTSPETNFASMQDKNGKSRGTKSYLIRKIAKQ